MKTEAVGKLSGSKISRTLEGRTTYEEVLHCTLHRVGLSLHTVKWGVGRRTSMGRRGGGSCSAALRCQYQRDEKQAPPEATARALTVLVT